VRDIPSGLPALPPRVCQERAEAENACCGFEQTAGRRRRDGTELWDLGTCKGYAAGRCSRICLMNCLNSGVVVAELRPHPECSRSILKFLGLRVLPTRKRFGDRAFSLTFILPSSSSSLAPQGGCAEQHVVPPTRRPGARHNLVEEIFVSDATVYWDSVVTKEIREWS
jgi:hypothetical protein